MKSRLHRWLLVPFALLLAACTTPMLVPEQSNRLAVKDFAIDARFALRVESTAATGGSGQNVSGRLLWRHSANSDYWLFSTPLGQAVAELESGAGGARLKQAGGEERRAADAGTLLRDLFGYELPVSRLPFWLLARPQSVSSLDLDGQGRPRQLTENGWQVAYAYDDENPNALPARLTVRREGEIELRLRIEEWQFKP